MWRVQPKRRTYFGPVLFEVQPLSWISRHKGIADKAWVESQVRYGEWKKDLDRQGYFSVHAIEFEGRKRVIIIINIKRLPDSVLVRHIHTPGKKK